MYNMTKVLFNNGEETLIKLKEIGLLSKTKEVKDLSNVVYKEIDKNDNVHSYPCTILGYNYKTTPFNTIYENLIVKSNNKVFNINIEHLIDMQKTSWNIKVNNKETSLENKSVSETRQSDNALHYPENIDDVKKFLGKDKRMVLIHLVTAPRKGVIIKIKNSKLSTPDAFLSTAIKTGFNKAMGTKLTYNQIEQKHYANRYSNINFKDDNKTFDLEYNMATFSLNHKIDDYIFIEEDLAIAELNSKKHNKIVAIDFKTACYQKASVCCINFVVEENNNIIESKSILIDPKVDFTTRYINKHGVTPLDVINAPTWDIAWKEVEKHITNSTLVIGHNIRLHELRCIREECKRFNMDEPNFAKAKKSNNMAYDTMKISKENYPELDNHKLETLTQHFGIDCNNFTSYAKVYLELFHLLKGDYSSISI